MDTFNIGMGLVKIGAGRTSIHDQLDPSAGIYLNIKIGDSIVVGDEIGIIFNSNDKKLKENIALFENCFKISDQLINPGNIIIDYS